MWPAFWVSCDRNLTYFLTFDNSLTKTMMKEKRQDNVPVAKQGWFLCIKGADVILFSNLTMKVTNFDLLLSTYSHNLWTIGENLKVYERGDYRGILHLRIKFSLFQVKVTVFDLLLLMYSYASNKYWQCKDNVKNSFHFRKVFQSNPVLSKWKRLQIFSTFTRLRIKSNTWGKRSFLSQGCCLVLDIFPSSHSRHDKKKM